MQSEDPANIDGQPITQELILDSDTDSDNEVVEVLVPKRVFLEISDSEDDSDIEIIESAPQLNSGSVNALPGPLLSRNRHDSIFNGDIRKKSNDMENRTSVDPREQFGGDKADEFMSISMDLDVISSERSENGEFVEIEEDVVMEIDSDAAALRRAAKGKGKAENQCSYGKISI